MIRNIIVFGATGNTGVKICEELSSLNIKYSAFVREGSEGKLKTELSEIISGDVLNKKDVKSAIIRQSFTDVIIALGSRDLKVENIRSGGTRNIVESLNESELSSKLHVISAHGVGDSWNDLKWYEKLLTNLFLKKTIKDHELQEGITIANPGGYHIIRPTALKNGPSTGKVHSQGEGALPKGEITRADVAKFLVSSMLSDKQGASSICKG